MKVTGAARHASAHPRNCPTVSKPALGHNFPFEQTNSQKPVGITKVTGVARQASAHPRNFFRGLTNRFLTVVTPTHAMHCEPLIVAQCLSQTTASLIGRILRELRERDAELRTGRGIWLCKEGTAWYHGHAAIHKRLCETAGVV
mmetsp:Transcript_82414/g.229631  ORF Transcript_82414/g.229631 Transcript_82414/m.229631 type:complete len:144 (-) Transcript_82414:1384-1815(-)